MACLWTKYADNVAGMKSAGMDDHDIWIQINCFDSMEKSEARLKQEKEQVPNITIINCENCKYDKCEFYNKSGNSWCPRCKGLNYHK